MTMKEAVRTCFQKYATFSGRASKAEFWKFFLFAIVGSIIATIINGIIFGPELVQEFTAKIDGSGNQTQEISTSKQYNGGWLGTIFSLIILLPWLAASCRRLHDTGRSGWWMLMPFAVSGIGFGLIFLMSKDVLIDASSFPEGVEMPATMPMISSPGLFLVIWFLAVISFIVLTVWLASASDPGTNKFGPNPHEVPS